MNQDRWSSKYIEEDGGQKLRKLRKQHILLLIAPAWQHGKKNSKIRFFYVKFLLFFVVIFRFSNFYQVFYKFKEFF